MDNLVGKIIMKANIRFNGELTQKKVDDGEKVDFFQLKIRGKCDLNSFRF